MLVFPAADRAAGAALVERVAPRPAVAGDPASLAEQFSAYAEVGVDELIVPTATLGEGSRRAEFLGELLGACTSLRG
jgi:hypothetical protein